MKDDNLNKSKKRRKTRRRLGEWAREEEETKPTQIVHRPFFSGSATRAVVPTIIILYNVVTALLQYRMSMLFHRMDRC